MKNLLAKSIMCLGLLLLCISAQAATYYFSHSIGDDSRSAMQAQNPSTPWKSIEKLNSVFKSLQPGDVVLFKRGETYYGSIKMSKSGAQGRPITLGAYGSGDKPIITSLVAAEKWTNVGGGIYEFSHPSFGSSLNIVLLNNKIQEMGRFPNSDAPYDGYLTIESTNGSNSISNNKISSLSNLKGGEVVIRKSYFTIDRHPIQSHAGSTIVYEKVSGTYNPNKNFGFFIQGHIKTLDQLGEWYYNPSTKKLSVYFGSNQPSSYVLQASTFDHLVTNDHNVGHIVFDNLQFKGANKNAFFLIRSQNIDIKNVDIEFSGENALYALNLPNLTIENSSASYSNNSGLIVYNDTPNAKVINNKVTNTNTIPGLGISGIGSGYAIEVVSDNSLVEYNEIVNTGYLGIRFGGNHTVVKNNY
ncbi:MAG TPA: right-handed parallel beta-helix repeat-containing protein, partial [Aequorivita sp.]|nr:right-handed parallel beta-helix repeat-containing protein [Aequorivita sp.]